MIKGISNADRLTWRIDVRMDAERDSFCVEKIAFLETLLLVWNRASFFLYESQEMFALSHFVTDMDKLFGTLQ